MTAGWPFNALAMPVRILPLVVSISSECVPSAAKPSISAAGTEPAA